MNLSRNLIHKILSRETLISIILIIIIFVIDRISKILIIQHQLENNSIPINNYLNFQLVWNSGIGFGLLSNSSSLFYHLITVLIFLIIVSLFYFIIKINLIDKIYFSLILGGAIGNFYDRVIFMAVPDFIDFYFKDFHWFTFNVADIFITLGIILLIIKDLIFKK